MGLSTLRIKVNNKWQEASVSSRTTLADFLRENLGLTGTKLGCEQGVCGACTVRVDGLLARSCLTLAAACKDAEVVTIEGTHDCDIERLRTNFSQEGALQCGFCTAGMLLTAHEIVRRRREMSRDQIATALAGNICRCTGYNGIVRAVQEANIDGLAEEDERSD